jgi:serpin B
LSLCYPGARGATQSELKKLLSYESYSDQDILDLNESFHTSMNALASENVALEMANKIYPKKGYELNQQYIEVVRKNFKSDIEPVNYDNASEAAGIINSWVAQKTQNKIKDLISPDAIDGLTRIILVNAIYFKGNWVNKFDANSTIQEDFHSESGSKVKVDMMRVMKKQLKYLANPANLEACVLELPYIDHNVSMTIILPNENTSLSKIENDLDSSKIKEILETHRSAKVNVYLPKFKLEYKKEVNLTQHVFYLLVFSLIFKINKKLIKDFK